MVKKVRKPPTTNRELFCEAIVTEDIAFIKRTADLFKEKGLVKSAKVLRNRYRELSSRTKKTDSEQVKYGQN
jgi:hypothetical protein